MPAAIPSASSPAPVVFATGDETGHIFTLVCVTLPPHDKGPPSHRHPHHVEDCYVAAGTIALTRGGSTTIVTAHTVVHIPPDTLHTFWNPTPAPATVLLVYQPGVCEAEALALATGALDEAEAW